VVNPRTGAQVGVRVEVQDAQGRVLLCMRGDGSNEMLCPATVPRSSLRQPFRAGLFTQSFTLPRDRVHVLRSREAGFPERRLGSIAIPAS